MKNPFSKKNPSQQEAFLRTYLDRIAPGVVLSLIHIFRQCHREVYKKRGAFSLSGGCLQLPGVAGKGFCDLPMPAV